MSSSSQIAAVLSFECFHAPSSAGSTLLSAAVPVGLPPQLGWYQLSTLQLDVLRGNAAHVLSLIARLLCMQVCEGGVVEEAGHLVGKASGLFQLLLA